MKKSPIIVFLWYVFVYMTYQYLRLVKKFNLTTWYQQRHLNIVLTYARQHTSYFRETLRGLNGSGNNLLEQMPILKKEFIKTHEKEVFGDDINLKHCKWYNTGGSTGEPLRFPEKRIWLPLEAAHQLIILKMMGWKYNETIVSISGYNPSEKDISQNKYYTENVKNFPYGKYQFSSFYLKNETIIQYIKDLNIIKPKVIVGYSSAVYQFCALVEQKEFTLDFKVKGVMITSDQYTAEEIRCIKRVLNCPVIGEYGHTEVSVFAIKPDNENEYRISPFYGYAEILDTETMRHVKEGEQGEIIVTGFISKGMPFIRYSTGDLAIYKGRNKFGEVIISELQGRTKDYVYTHDKERVFLTGFIFGNHLHAFDHIALWQLEQNEYGKVTIHLVKGNGYSEEDEKELISHFEGKTIELTFDYCDDIEKTLRGKRLFMKQHLN